MSDDYLKSINRIMNTDINEYCAQSKLDNRYSTNSEDVSEEEYSGESRIADIAELDNLLDELYKAKKKYASNNGASKSLKYNSDQQVYIPTSLSTISSLTSNSSSSTSPISSSTQQTHTQSSSSPNNSSIFNSNGMLRLNSQLSNSRKSIEKLIDSVDEKNLIITDR